MKIVRFSMKWLDLHVKFGTRENVVYHMSDYRLVLAEGMSSAFGIILDEKHRDGQPLVKNERG